MLLKNRSFKETYVLVLCKKLLNEKNLKKQLEGAYQHWLEFWGKNEYLLGHCVVSLTEKEIIKAGFLNFK